MAVVQEPGCGAVSVFVNASGLEAAAGKCRCNYGMDGGEQKSHRSPVLSRNVLNTSLVFL